MRLALLLTLCSAAAAAAELPSCAWRVKQHCFLDDGVWVESATADVRPCRGRPDPTFDYIKEVDGYIRMTERVCVPGVLPSMVTPVKKSAADAEIAKAAAAGGSRRRRSNKEIAFAIQKESANTTAQAEEVTAGPQGPGEAAPAPAPTPSTGSWRPAPTFRKDIFKKK